MQFYSLKFLLFLAVAFSIFYLTKKNYKYLSLLIMSYIFYSFFSLKHLPVLVFITALNFFGAGIISARESDRSRKILFILVLFLNIVTLFAFKYLVFSIQNVNFFLHLLHSGIYLPEYSLQLPLGLSFYIFATLGYVIDVYRRNIQPEKNYLKFSVFGSFFPVVQSGPIERSTNFLKQLNGETFFDYTRIRYGIFIILSGIIKKYLIADRLSLICNPVFENINQYNGFFIAFSVIIYAFQIYYDFSGYSDIAIGLGRLFGYEIKRNFNIPYSAKSISEFWKRWHISLSEWLRDYIFLPIAYYTSRKYQNIKFIKPENISYYSAVFITMFIAGLWHGASWNYIIWGLIFAFSMIISQMTKKIRKRILKKTGMNKKLLNVFRVLFTFFIVCFAWIFFRTNNINEAAEIIAGIINADFINPALIMGNYNMHFSKVPLLTAVLGLVFLVMFEIAELFDRKYGIYQKFDNLGIHYRWVIYAILILFVLFFAVSGDTKFIYFRY